MTLKEIHRDEKSRLKVECAGNMVSVSSYCAFCVHCGGLDIGGKTHAPPLDTVTSQVTPGGPSDDALMNAMMQFNTLATGAQSVVCNDDEHSGFRSRFRS